MVMPQGNSLPVVEIVLNGAPERLPLAELTPSLLRQCGAVRGFRWHKGQSHFPGSYWSSTTSGFVGYESRLELSRLLLADHDPDVAWVVSQPFRLIGRDYRGRARRHVPDYALAYESDHAMKVVNVKPAPMLSNPKVSEPLAWAHGLLEAVGITTEIWSFADPQVLINLRYLAGFRNPALVPTVDVARAVDAVGAKRHLRDAERELVDTIDQPRPALLRALWMGRLRCDLYRPIGMDTLLEAV